MQTLRPYNTFGIDANCRQLISITSEQGLQNALKQYDIDDIFVLGGGSNILLKTDYLDKIVLKIDTKGVQIVRKEAQYVEVEVQAGEVWHDFVLWTLAQDLGGLENLSLIPGCVGASPIQNIGAYGVEVKDRLTELRAIEKSTGKVHIFKNEDCHFGYRESIFKKKFKNRFIITAVNFRLTRAGHHQLNTSYGGLQKVLEEKGITQASIQSVSDAVIAVRQSKLPDPANIGNAGSFFKNPIILKNQFEKIIAQFPNAPHYPIDEERIKVPAGWLIDTLGWKGKTYKGAAVHTRQALVLVNAKQATGEAVYELSSQILADVKQHFGIELEREVNIIQ